MKKKVLLCLTVVAIAVLSLSLVACGAGNLDDVLEESAIENALSNATITYVSEYVAGEESGSREMVYKFADGIQYQCVMEDGEATHERYYAEIDGRYYEYLYNDAEEKWNRADVSDEYVTYDASEIEMLTSLRADFFDKDGDYYTMKSSKYLDYYALVMGENIEDLAQDEQATQFCEGIEYIKIKIADGKIVEYVMKSSHSEEFEGETFTASSTITLTITYGGVTLTLPEIEEAE